MNSNQRQKLIKKSYLAIKLKNNQQVINNPVDLKNKNKILHPLNIIQLRLLVFLPKRKRLRNYNLIN